MTDKLTSYKERISARSRKMLVTTTVAISEQVMRDIVITGVEGGIGYWCQVDRWAPVSDEASILKSRFREQNDDGTYGDWMTLDLQKFAEAIVVRANQMGYAIDGDLSGRFDAIDADVAIQTALLGEIVYG